MGRIMKLNVKDDFARNLKAARIRQGLTQEGLAERAGMMTRVIQRLEQLPGKNTSLETIQKLASGLGMQPVDLIAPNSNPKKLSKKEKDSIETAIQILRSIVE